MKKNNTLDWRVRLLRWNETLSVILIFVTVVLTALIYPFLIREDVVNSFARTFAGHCLGVSFWRPYLTMEFSVSIIKESAFILFGFPLGLCLLFSLYLQGPKREHKKPLERLKSPWTWVLVFWIYCALRCLPSGKFIPMFLQNPTPATGLQNLLCITVGLFIIMVLFSLTRPERFLRPFMTVVCCVGCILALMSVAQHLDLTESFFPKIPDPRNRVGSFIGHNVGLSAWLVFPLSFSVYMFLDKESSRLRRILCALLIILFCWVLIAAESRSIWIFLLIGFPIYLLWQMHLLDMASRHKWSVMLTLLLVLVAGVASQSLAPKYNILASKHQVALRERLKSFTFDTLKTETRLRILVCSIPLIEERPLLGYGLGAFQYVYQPAQGNWLSRHPDSVIVGTWKRTDVAHNDPLQLLVELGLVGAVLALVALSLLFARVRKIYAAEDSGGKMRRLALLFPVAVILAQSFVDFPFHIVSVSAVCIASFGFLGAQKKTIEEQLPVTKPSLTYRAVIVLSMIILCYWFSNTVVFVYRGVRSDHFNSMGGKQITYARGCDPRDFENKGKQIMNAKALQREAMHSNVFNGKAYEDAAIADIEMARLLETVLSDCKDTSEALMLKQAVIGNYEAARPKLQQQRRFGELNYHYTYYLDGQINMGLWHLTKDAKYLTAARKDFEAAVTMNPADMYSHRELIDAWNEEPNRNKVKVTIAKNNLFKYDATMAYEAMLKPLWEMALRGETDAAIGKCVALGHELPTQWRISIFNAELYMLTALWPPQDVDRATTSGLRQTVWAKQRMTAAENMLNTVVEHAPPDEVIDMAKLHFLVLSGKYDEALALAASLRKKYPKNLEFIAIEQELATRAGKHIKPSPLASTHQNELYNIVRFYRVFYMDELADESSIVYISAKENRGRQDTACFVRVGEYVINHGRPDMAEALIDWMKKFDPTSDRLTTLQGYLDAMKNTQ